MDKKPEGGKAQGDEVNELVCEACTLEGCDERMRCFGGSVKWLCVEAIARYNELRKKELEEKRKAFVESQLIDLTEEEETEEFKREARATEKRIMEEVDE